MLGWLGDGDRLATHPGGVLILDLLRRGEAAPLRFVEKHKKRPIFTFEQICVRHCPMYS